MTTLTTATDQITDALCVRSMALLPENPTQADTIHLFQQGVAVEHLGRHMKRVALAAEQVSGRNMEEFYQLVGISASVGRDLIQEARTFGMLPSRITKGEPSAAERQAMADVAPRDNSPAENLEASAFSQAFPSKRDARLVAKLSDEEREEIKRLAAAEAKDEARALARELAEAKEALAELKRARRKEERLPNSEKQRLADITADAVIARKMVENRDPAALHYNYNFAISGEYLEIQRIKEILKDFPYEARHDFIDSAKRKIAMHQDLLDWLTMANAATCETITVTTIASI